VVGNLKICDAFSTDNCAFATVNVALAARPLGRRCSWLSLRALWYLDSVLSFYFVLLWFSCHICPCHIAVFYFSNQMCSSIVARQDLTPVVSCRPCTPTAFRGATIQMRWRTGWTLIGTATPTTRIWWLWPGHGEPEFCRFFSILDLDTEFGVYLYVVCSIMCVCLLIVWLVIFLFLLWLLNNQVHILVTFNRNANIGFFFHLANSENTKLSSRIFMHAEIRFDRSNHVWSQNK